MSATVVHPKVIFCCTVHKKIFSCGFWDGNLWKSIMAKRHELTLREDCCDQCERIARHSLDTLWTARYGGAAA